MWFANEQGLLVGVAGDAGTGDWGTAMNDQLFEDWRRLHGQEFARYHGLKVHTHGLARLIFIAAREGKALVGLLNLKSDTQEAPATRREADALVQRKARALPPPVQLSYNERIGFSNPQAEALQRCQHLRSALVTQI
jgi:hypothetical protein